MADNNRTSLLVRATWDDEARVWVAESDDVPGLVTEASTTKQLLAKLRVLVSELLELNHCGEKATMKSGTAR